MDSTKYETVAQDLQPPISILNNRPIDPTEPIPPPPVHTGNDLLHPKILDPVRWYLLFIIFNAIVSFGVLVWVAGGPEVSSGKRVLPTGSIKVDQFYSGLALSAVLTPAAVVIRQLSSQFGQTHPFALAARTPVRSTDLDKIIGPSLLDLLCILRYSKWMAIVQTVLMLSGTLLVPLGTLIVTTGQYAPQTKGTAIVGMPTDNGYGEIMYLDVMDNGFSNELNDFATTVANLVKSDIIMQNGVLTSTPEVLGPVSTSNITFETGLLYHSVVAYSWKANCQGAETEIEYQLDSGGSSATFTFPDGSQNTTWTSSPTMNVWSNATESAGQMFNMGGGAETISIPYAGTLYFAVAGDLANTFSLPTERSTLTMTNSTWISRAKCTPRLTWEVSSCVWDGDIMSNCTATPKQNVTQLDTVGLNHLNGHMTTVPWVIANQADTAVNMEILTVPFVYWPASNYSHQMRAPSITDYTNLFGAVAQSITIATTAGYYGTAEVSTVGGPETEVYIARVYMLAIVFLILLAVASLGVTDQIRSTMQRLPFRRATFLTIASAVRGQWWDRELYGTCAMPERKLRKRYGRSVMFGVDVTYPEHVGLAPVVKEIEETVRYLGVD